MSLSELPESTQTHVHRVGDAIQPSHPLLSTSPPSPNPSQHQTLSNESTLSIRWPKYCSFSFSIIPSKEIPGLISFRMGWLDLLGSPRDSQESSPTPQAIKSNNFCSSFRPLSNYTKLNKIICPFIYIMWTILNFMFYTGNNNSLIRSFLRLEYFTTSAEGLC